MLYGVVIQGLYITYFMVVKGMLSAWVCTTKENGAAVLAAEPSLSCSHPSQALLLMRKVSIAAIVLYAVGIPCVFGYILFRHRKAIHADQVLLAKGLGSSALTNPNFRIRQRYNQLYETFSAGKTYWRLVLILRKFAIVFVAVYWAAYPMLQASLSVAIIFASYALQVQHRPFLDASNEHRLDVTKVRQQGAVRAYAVPFNRLEAGYLVTSMVTLFAGMIFQSGSISAGSRAYMFLVVVVSETAIVACESGAIRTVLASVCCSEPVVFVWLVVLVVQIGTVLVGSVTLFLGIIVMEIYRAVRFARRVDYILRKRPGGQRGSTSGSGEAFLYCFSRMPSCAELFA